jgi:serine/threonine protein kinase
LRCIPPRPPLNIDDLFPESDLDALDLLDQMIQFNPDQRSSVDVLLSHKFFKEVRNPIKEKEAKRSISLDIDEKEEINEEILREGFLKEIQELRKVDS